MTQPYFIGFTHCAFMNRIGLAWLPPEYPRECNVYNDYSLPPTPGVHPLIEVYSICYERYHATKSQIDARIAAEQQRIAAQQQQIVKAQQIAIQQAELNKKYEQLFAQYQGLEKAYRDEKLAHEQETAQMIQIRLQITQISKILRDVGLIV